MTTANFSKNELSPKGIEKLERYLERGHYGQLEYDSWPQHHYPDPNTVKLVGVTGDKGECFINTEDGFRLWKFVQKIGRFFVYAVSMQVGGEDL